MLLRTRQSPTPSLSGCGGGRREGRQAIGQSDREPLAIEPSSLDQDQLNELTGKTLPDILQAAFLGTNKAYADDSRRTATIRTTCSRATSGGRRGA